MSPSKAFGLILAGGQSKRLFPETLPKPLLEVRGVTLLEMALKRLEKFEAYVVTNAEIASEIERVFKAKKLKIPHFAIEPEGRDTAAAVGFGIRYIKDKNPETAENGWVAVLSADQWMPSRTGFGDFLTDVESEIIKSPSALFVAGSLASTKDAETHSQFGWIQPRSKGDLTSVSFEVEKFIEKPTGDDLIAIREKGGLINAGMFYGMWKTFYRAYQSHYPDVLNPKVSYATLKRLPVDRALFENFSEVRAIPLPLQWEDLGTWKDWHAHTGAGDGIRKNAEGTFLSSDSDFKIHAYGVQNLAIVQRGKRILVMPIAETPQLKNYLDEGKV